MCLMHRLDTAPIRDQICAFSVLENDLHPPLARPGSAPGTPSPVAPAPAGFGLSYGPAIETEIARLVPQIQARPGLAGYPARWLAVKLLEGEADLVDNVNRVEGGPALNVLAAAGAARIAAGYGDEADIAIADARYQFVNGVVRDVVDASQAETTTLTDTIDRVVTNRLLGLPIFLMLMYMVFKLVVDVSAPFLDWVDFVVSGPLSRWTAALLGLLAAPDWLSSLVLEGIIPGVGGVLVFLPGLFVLYFFLTLLEDSGYMARAAFVMDRVMSFLGLHGKSFIPLILGFGCNVPAIYATRTIENRRDRIITGLLVPLMSCSARLPVYVVFGLALFPRHADVMIVGLYSLGLVMATLVGLILTRLLPQRGEAAFVLELPPYRLPTWRNLMLHTWEKSKEFVQKAGTVILAVSVVLWFLMNLPWGVTHPRDSLFGRTSAAVAPLFAPAGFGSWEAAGALVSGAVAKEVVVSTMSQIYSGSLEAAETPEQADLLKDSLEIITGFGRAALESGKILVSLLPGLDLTGAGEPGDDRMLIASLQSAFSPLTAVAFVIFVLLYTPCVATLGAIRAEYGWRWMWVSALYQFGLAWLLAVVVFQAGRLLGWG